MSRASVADAVLAHIGHAEQWLRRARADYERGDLHRVVLRLLLAEAEIRRARESGTSIVEIPRRPAQVPWGIVGTVVAVGLILAGLNAVIQPQAASPRHAPHPLVQGTDLVRPGQGRDGLPAVVRFDTGQVLPFVGFPARPSGMAAAPDATVGDVDRLLTISDDSPALVTFR